MQTMPSIATQLSLSSLVPFIVIALSLIVRGKERLGGRIILGIMVLIIALVSSISVISASRELEVLFNPLFLGNFTIGALGPLLYFYFRINLDRKFVFAARRLWVFVPVAIPLVFVGVFLITDNMYLLSRELFVVHRIVESFWLLAWWLVTLLPIKKTEIRLRDFFFDFRNLRLTWLRFLYVTILLLWLGKFYLFMQYAYAQSPETYIEGVSFFFLIMLFFLSILMYLVMNRSAIFEVDKKHVTQEGLSLHFTRLDELIRSKKLYLNPDLDLVTLSNRSGLHPKVISQVINAHARTNLNDYLNRHRIDHAKTLLANKGSNDKILSILLDSGFNSKSAFNAAFKKFTGLTPNEFRQKSS